MHRLNFLALNQKKAGSNPAQHACMLKKHCSVTLGLFYFLFFRCPLRCPGFIETVISFRYNEIRINSGGSYYEVIYRGQSE